MKNENRMVTVRETEPAKSVGAFAIIDKNGDLAVTVNIWYKEPGRIKVSFFDHDRSAWITKESTDIVAACKGVTLAGRMLHPYGSDDEETKAVEKAHPAVTTIKGAKARAAVLKSFGMTSYGEGVQYVPGLARLECFGYRIHQVL